MSSYADPLTAAGGYGAYGGADVSTVNPNPSIDDFATTSPGTDWSSALNVAGQWGSTIASIVTGNRVAVAPVQTGPYAGTYQTVGVAGSQAVTPGIGSSQLLILGIFVVIVVLLVSKK